MNLKEEAIAILGAQPLGESDPSGRQPTTRLDNTVISRLPKINKDLNKFFNSKPKFYTIKLIQSGPIVEIKEYEKPVAHNWPPPKKSVMSFYDFDENGERKKLIDKDRSLEHKKRNAYKSKNKIVRLATTNFKFGDKFLTLTFKDNIDFDITNISECNRRCSNFIRKLSRRFKNLKYIKVVEFQDKYDRGAVHYHLLCSLPFVHWSVLTKLWGYGGIDIVRPKTTTEIAIYISKYMTKYSIDKRFEKNRRFSYSKNLKHPKVKIDLDAFKSKKSFERLGIKPTYEAIYDSTCNGKVKYTRYNLEDLSARKD